MDGHLGVEADGDGVVGLGPQAVEILDVDVHRIQGLPAVRLGGQQGLRTHVLGDVAIAVVGASGSRCRRVTANRSSAPHMTPTALSTRAVSATFSAPSGVSTITTTSSGASAATCSADSVLASITVVYAVRA